MIEEKLYKWELASWKSFLFRHKYVGSSTCVFYQKDTAGLRQCWWPELQIKYDFISLFKSAIYICSFRGCNDGRVTTTRSSCTIASSFSRAHSPMPHRLSPQGLRVRSGNLKHWLAEWRFIYLCQQEHWESPWRKSMWLGVDYCRQLHLS